MECRLLCQPICRSLAVNLVRMLRMCVFVACAGLQCGSADNAGCAQPAAERWPAAGDQSIQSLLCAAFHMHPFGAYSSGHPPHSCVLAATLR